MNLNIVTYCKNLDNLDLIYESFESSSSYQININWYVIYKNENDYFYKNNLNNVKIFQIYNKQSKYDFLGYNLALDIISDGFIYFLDEENIMHSNFWNDFLFFTVDNFYSFLFENLPNHITSKLRVLKISNFAYKKFTITTGKHNFGNFSSYELALFYYYKFIKKHKNKINKLQFFCPISPNLGHYTSGCFCFHSKHLNNIRFSNVNNLFQDFFEKLLLQKGFKNCFIDKVLSYYNFLNTNSVTK